MTLQCAIFDFDGTLFDSMHVWDNVASDYLISQGKTPHNRLRHDLETLSLTQAAQYFQIEYGVNASVEEILVEIDRIVEHAYAYDIQPKTYVREFLDMLTSFNISLYIATATRSNMIRKALKRCDFDRYFSDVVSCEDIGASKEDPTIYRTIIDTAHVQRHNTLVCEDAFYALKTAHNDGFITMGVYDVAEKKTQEMRQLSDFYLTSYANKKQFLDFMNEKFSSQFSL